MALKRVVHAHALTNSSPEIGAPDLAAITHEPLAWLEWDAEREEDGSLTQQAIYSNYNDTVRLDVDTNTLVGREDPGRGPVQRITIVPPVVLRDNKLTVDFTLLSQDQIESLRALLE